VTHFSQQFSFNAHSRANRVARYDAVDAARPSAKLTADGCGQFETLMSESDRSATLDSSIWSILGG